MLEGMEGEGGKLREYQVSLCTYLRGWPPMESCLEKTVARPRFVAHSQVSAQVGKSHDPTQAK